jgi:hypothetical protein
MKLWYRTITTGGKPALEICEPALIWTGYYDENNVKVFEGDIVEYTDDGPQYGIVRYRDGCFYIDDNYDNLTLAEYCYPGPNLDLQVIGDIKDQDLSQYIPPLTEEEQNYVNLFRKWEKTL